MQHFRTSKFFPRETWFTLIMFLVCVATHCGKEIVCCVGSECVCAISQTHCIPLASLFMENIVFQNLFWQSQVQGVCVHSKIFIIVGVTKLLEEIVAKFGSNILCLAVWHIVEKKNPTMIDSLCSISGFTSSTSYSWSIMWLRRLNILLFIAPCVYSSFKYFVTVYRLRAIIWYPYELLASSFIVSATTLEFGFSSPWRRAFRANCTKLLKHFLGTYWRTQGIFRTPVQPSSTYFKSNGVMSVPLVGWKHDISLLLGWAIQFSFSAYFLIKIPISALLTTVFFEYWRKVWEVTFQIFGHFNITLNVSKEFPINNSLQKLFFAHRTLLWKIFLGDEFWLRHQFHGNTTIHTPLSQQIDILSVVCNPYASCLAPFFLLLSQYLHHSEKLCFWTKRIVIITSHSFKNSVTMIANSVYTEKKINFLFLTISNITLKFTVRSKLLKNWLNHIVKRKRFILVWSGGSLSHSPILYANQ